MEQKSFKIAFISDVHVDSYVRNDTHSPSTVEKLIDTFIDTHLQLESADILVIAGDISHYVELSQLFFKVLVERKLFKKIFVTFGNHDLYMCTQMDMTQYKTSWDKILDLKRVCASFDGIEFLDGGIIDVDGVSIGGCGCWYDFTYGYSQFGLNKFQMMHKWKDHINDANYIKGTDSPTEINDSRTSSLGEWGYRKIKQYSFDPIKFFETEKLKLEAIIEKCDIFVSHVGPVVPDTLRPEYQTPVTGCFYFDGLQYLNAEKAPKLWIFGHTHDSYNFKINNTTLMCNPLGYKSENKNTVVATVDYFEL
jgi:predicted phosphodiesterase